jgi:hypothetical protein
MTENEANEMLDRLFTKKHTGKTYAADKKRHPGAICRSGGEPDVPWYGPDSLAQIRRDFPDIFLPRTSDRRGEPKQLHLQQFQGDDGLTQRLVHYCLTKAPRSISF